jgi:hypothetical protein
MEDDPTDVHAQLSTYFDAMARIRQLEIQLDASAPKLEEAAVLTRELDEKQL